jgi:hypothetical protein
MPQGPKVRKVQCACGWLGLVRDMRVRSIFRECLVTTYICWRCVRRKVVWGKSMHEPVVLWYTGRLPKVSNKRLPPMARYRLKRADVKVFGILPPMCYPTVKATVQVIRVLEPGQKPMDRDNLALMVAGLVDALKPSYLVDERERWADIRSTNDETRREKRPMIEIRIAYATRGARRDCLEAGGAR